MPHTEPRGSRSGRTERAQEGKDKRRAAEDAEPRTASVPEEASGTKPPEGTGENSPPFPAAGIEPAPVHPSRDTMLLHLTVVRAL